MRSTLILTFLALIVLPASAQRQRPYDLPAGAQIIETQPVTQNRTLVLWMLKPAKHPRAVPGETYTCPEETRGSYYSGPTRVSLVDTATRKTINTIDIRQEYSEGIDEFDLPYQIHAGSYYQVKGVRVGKEGKPTIMWLRDINGDGQAREFALYDALACMGLQTALIGYSEGQDKVIQYSIELVVKSGGKTATEARSWADYLFSGKPKTPGYWKFEVDYRGRAGSLDKYEIRYNKQAERFEGQVEYIEGD